MTIYNSKENQIDNAKLEAIKIRIIYEEKANVKTKAKSGGGMVEVLKSIIVEEVNKKY